MEDEVNVTDVWRFAFTLGYQVALPLILFGIGGRLLDRSLGTKPWLFLVGISIAVVSSTVMVYRHVTDILNGIKDRNDSVSKNRGKNS